MRVQWKFDEVLERRDVKGEKGPKPINGRGCRERDTGRQWQRQWNEKLINWYIHGNKRNKGRRNSRLYSLQVIERRLSRCVQTWRDKRFGNQGHSWFSGLTCCLRANYYVLMRCLMKLMSSSINHSSLNTFDITQCRFIKRWEPSGILITVWRNIKTLPEFHTARPIFRIILPASTVY